MAGPSSRIAELLDHSHGSRKVDPGRIADFRDLVDRNVPPHIAAVEAGLSEADEHFLRMSGELGTTLEGGDNSTSTTLPADDGSAVAKAVDTEASPAGNGQLSDDGDHLGQLRNEARLQGPPQGYSNPSVSTATPANTNPSTNSPILSRLFGQDPLMVALVRQNGSNGRINDNGNLFSRGPASTWAPAGFVQGPSSANANMASATIAVPRTDAATHAHGWHDPAAQGRRGAQDSNGQPAWSQDIKQRDGQSGHHSSGAPDESDAPSNPLDRLARLIGTATGPDAGPRGAVLETVLNSRLDQAGIPGMGQERGEVARHAAVLADSHAVPTGHRADAVAREGMRGNIANDAPATRSATGSDNSGSGHVPGDIRQSNVQHRDAIQGTHTPGNNDNDGRRQGQSGDGQTLAHRDATSDARTAAGEARASAFSTHPAQAVPAGAIMAAGQASSNMKAAYAPTVQSASHGPLGDGIGSHAQLSARSDLGTAAPVTSESAANLSNFGRDATQPYPSALQQAPTQGPPVRTDMQHVVQTATLSAAGSTALANPQGATTATAPLMQGHLQPAGVTVAGGRDALTAQPGGHTNSGSMQRELRDGAHPRHKPVHWVLSMLAPGFLQHSLTRHRDRTQNLGERMFWTLTITAYLALGCSIAAMLIGGSNRQLFTNTGTPTVSGYALAAAALASIGALVLGKRVRRQQDKS